MIWLRALALNLCCTSGASPLIRNSMTWNFGPGIWMDLVAVFSSVFVFVLMSVSCAWVPVRQPAVCVARESFRALPSRRGMCHRPPVPTDDRIDDLVRRLEEFAAAIRAIEAKAAAEREAAIARSGLPRELVLQILGPTSVESPLTPNVPYATIQDMSTSFVAEPRKPGRPLGAGPVAKAAKKLGLSMPKLAKAIGVNENTVKAWNARNAIPDDGQAKIDALLAKAKRDASK